MARPPRGSADMERIWLPCSVVPFYSLTPSKTEQCYFFVKFSQNFSKRNALRRKSPRPVLPWTGTFHGEEAAGRFLQLKGEDGGEQGADGLIPQVGVNENAVMPVSPCAMGQTAKYDVGSEMPMIDLIASVSDSLAARMMQTGTRFIRRGSAFPAACPTQPFSGAGRWNGSV